MNLYELLSNDHAGIKAMFSRLEGTTEKEIEEREEIFALLKIELIAHGEAEEIFFYSILYDEEESRENALEAIKDHEDIANLLEEMENTKKNPDQWKAKLKALKEDTLHHIKEEEDVLFRLAKMVLNDDEANEIADQIEAYKEDFVGMFK